MDWFMAANDFCSALFFSCLTPAFAYFNTLAKYCSTYVSSLCLEVLARLRETAGVANSLQRLLPNMRMGLSSRFRTRLPACSSFFRFSSCSLMTSFLLALRSARSPSKYWVFA